MDRETILNYRTGETLIFTFTNLGYCDFVRNIAKSIEKAGCSWKFVVFCLDNVSVDKLTPHGIICVPYFKQVSSNLEKFGDGGFKKVSFEKLNIINDLLDLLDNSEVKYLFYLDSDIVIFKDCLDHLIEQIQDKEILFQCDERGLHCSGDCRILCTGFIFIKVRKDNQRAFSYSNDEYSRNCQDQEHVNNKRGKMGSNFPIIKTLSKQNFPNGSLIDSNLIDKYMFHYNWILSHDKKNKMIQKGHWFI